MRTEPRAQLHKPVKKIFFYSSWGGGASAPGAPPAYATDNAFSLACPQSRYSRKVHRARP